MSGAKDADERDSCDRETGSHVGFAIVGHGFRVHAASDAVGVLLGTKDPSHLSDYLGSDRSGDLGPALRRALAGKAGPFRCSTLSPQGRTIACVLIPFPSPDDAERVRVALFVEEIRSCPVIVPHLEGRCPGAFHGETALDPDMAEMKNEFVSTVSHELRTPLTSIKGYVDLIVDGQAGEINETQREFLEIVQENSDRLVTLINDMLDISRIESGRIHFTIEPVDIADLVIGTMDAFRAVADAAGIELVANVDPATPRAAADRNRVGQVLMNLVSNAVKYSPGGGAVTITARGKGGSVVIEVGDRGIGIKPEDQERLFTKFFRVDSSLTRDIGGTGLGLSICKSIVELLGGTIWVRSELGSGSVFGFSLPVAPPDLVRAPPVEGPDAIGGSILVVDRDPSVSGLIQTYLERRGYDVLKAATAREAMRLAVAYRPRAITLDVMLDDGDGFDLLQRLKGDPRTSSIPVVVLSVVCDEGRSMRLGAANYLEKPLDHTKLVSVIDGLVGEVASPLVLVADDDRGIVSSISQVLKARGFAVIPGFNGREAIAAARSSRPNLILLDLRMPEVDGYQVIQELKIDPSTAAIPIVVMTAHRIDHTRMGIIEMTAAQVAKPFSAEVLLDRIGSLLSEVG